MTLLAGGNGGFGNAHFQERYQPGTLRRCLPAGEEKGADPLVEVDRRCWLIGLPNAGKSTFLSRTAARPKIAD
ncbi:MAG: hypothetical protein H6924_03845 [Alphaproteobacteria bacterium]|nr:hypothetical protein [Alphaproteobacteria bacterium]